MPTLENGLHLQPDPVNIAIVEDVDKSGGLDRMLKARGLQPRRIKNSKDPEALVSALLAVDAHAAITRTSSTFSRQVLEESRLSVVQGACKGPHADVEAAQGLGTEVLKVDTNRQQVIDLVEACVRAAASGLAIGNNYGRNGEWSKGETSKTILPMDEMRVGIVGYGDIGQGVAERLSPHVEGMGAHNHRFELERPYDKRIRQHADGLHVGWFPTLDELLEWANVLSLHVDEMDAMGTPNKGLISVDLLRQWGEKNTINGIPTGILLNIARGSLTPSLAELNTLLNEGVLHSAYVDAHAKELEVKGKFALPPNAHPGLVTTPHIGGSGKRIEINTGKDVDQVLSTWIDEGSFNGSRVFQHEVMDAAPLRVEGNMLLRVARSTQRGSSDAIEQAIMKAGLENLGGDLSLTDRVAGSRNKTWSVVPHIIAMGGFNGNYADKVNTLARELDAVNGEGKGRVVVAARFIPTSPEQRATLREMIR